MLYEQQPIFVCTVAVVILCFQLFLTLTGAALAAAGALAAWVSVPVTLPVLGVATNTAGFFASSVTALGQTFNFTYAPVGQYGAAAAMLLLGGNFALIYFIALLVNVWVVCRVNQALVDFGFLFLASLAFVCTFLGTILGGSVRLLARCQLSFPAPPSPPRTFQRRPQLCSQPSTHTTLLPCDPRRAPAASPRLCAFPWQRASTTPPTAPALPAPLWQLCTWPLPWCSRSTSAPSPSPSTSSSCWSSPWRALCWQQSLPLGAGALPPFFSFTWASRTSPLARPAAPSPC